MNASHQYQDQDLFRNEDEFRSLQNQILQVEYQPAKNGAPGVDRRTHNTEIDDPSYELHLTQWLH
jgi:hypothetical protein